MKIGVFDSGIGGLSVANAVKAALPEHEIHYATDKKHVPYGDKTAVETFGFVLPILRKMAADGCDVIVIACNTVTTLHITALRKLIAVPLVGIEPMVKPAAAQTTTGTIAVCATPTTLASQRYNWLKRTYAQDVAVLEPDCGSWAHMIEHNRANELKLTSQINHLCDAGADVIVLGCTHYHWIEDRVRQLAQGRAIVIQPEVAVVKQLKRVLARLTASLQHP